ncbi:MAG TPA: hypothetical protein VET88_06025 [Gammaproteobacteria bacterium]|nr:hypothetical protein [Gammaproteobacteria bacterium]
MAIRDRVLLPALFTAVVSGCGGDGQDPDPLVEDFGIAYVQRPLQYTAGGVVIQPDLRVASEFTPGGELYYRDLASPGAAEHNITTTITRGMGDVKDVDVSYDGNRLLFALREPDIPGADPEDQPTWNIWEYTITTGELRRVIGSDITSEAGQDVAPHYLPDGRIIFSSTRQRQSRAVLLDEGKPQFAALDEDLNEAALVLHVMNADGSDIHQVSYNQSHDLDPTVLVDGRVLFSRWDNMGSRNAISLYSMRPDGTGLHLHYGAHSHASGTNGSDVQFMQPRELDNGHLLGLLLPFSGTHRGGDLVIVDTEDYIENNQPVAASSGILSGPAQASATINNVMTNSGVSPGGRFRSAWPLQDGTDRILVSWSECRLLEAMNIVPCTPDRLAGNPIEADPLYGIFLYAMDSDTQLPVVVPREGFLFTDVVAAAPRQLPEILFDAQAGIELDPQYAAEGVGILDIRSVYDVDGIDTAVPDIGTLADPAQTLAQERPARFLRIVKAVGIPDDRVLDSSATAFGRSSQQLMREIIGYVPVQPDGSVRVKVPANIPLAVSVVDSEGRRISARHQNWLQLRAGETVTCHGCHDHASGLPHGHPQGPASVYTGAPATGQPFPNTDPALFANYGETMAGTLTRLDTQALLPSVDLVYTDVWTDELMAGRPKDAGRMLAYSDLATPAPVSSGCQQDWVPTCRTVIHYEQHIHPLWSRDRGADTCIACHTSIDAAGDDKVPDGQLDLADGPSQDQSLHFKAYRELLFPDFAEELGLNGLQDKFVPGPLDPVTGMPTQVRVSVAPAMSTAGALASAAFVTRFEPGGSHESRLEAAELRLVYEWLDIGAQYFNDPFAAPQN